jgi:hypothetical protein
MTTSTNITTLRALYALWDALADIPVFDDDSGEFEVGAIEEPFLHFPVGTHAHDIWHWFESVNPRFIVGEVMEGRRIDDEDSEA